MKQLLSRFWFVALVTAVLVFFSEKAYWYPQGYAIAELLLFYAVPVYACLWAINRFQVQKLSGVILIAALFAFLIEGVLTPVMYEAGLFDPILPAYFIGWHGLLAVVFGWYGIRRWLLTGQWPRLFAASVLFGIFWGIWALVYWLPENKLAFVEGGRWPTAQFGWHALTFTLLLMLGHWLLGQGGWQATFVPGRWEKWGVTAVLIFFFVTLALPAAPLGILKLLLLVTAVFLPLEINRRRQPSGTLFADLAGSVQARHLLPLLAMPLLATAVYQFAVVNQPTETMLHDIFELVPLAQALLGAFCFGGALIVTLWPLDRRKCADE